MIAHEVYSPEARARSLSPQSFPVQTNHQLNGGGGGSGSDGGGSVTFHNANTNSPPPYPVVNNINQNPAGPPFYISASHDHVHILHQNHDNQIRNTQSLLRNRDNMDGADGHLTSSSSSSNLTKVRLVQLFKNANERLVSEGVVWRSL